MWAVTGLVFTISTVAGVVVFAKHSATVPDNDAYAIEQARRQTDECVRHFTESLPDSEREMIASDFGFDASSMTENEWEEFLRSEMCFQDPAWYRPDDPRFFATTLLVDTYQAYEIDDWSADRRDYSTANTFRSGVQTYRQAEDGLVGVVPVVATFYLVIAVLIGASFVGAEYKSGTLENLLLWEPRRVRVLWTKFAAGFVSSAVLTATLLTWLTALLYFVATQRGSTGAVDGRFWIDVGSTIARGAVIGGLFFVAAMSVSVVARNTTAAVGVILGWFAVSNIVIELTARWLRPWELFNNSTAFIREADAVRYTKIQGYWSTIYSHGYLRAGMVTAVWVAVMATVATAVFVRRDID